MPYRNWISFGKTLFYTMRLLLITIAVHWILVVVPAHYNAFPAESAWNGWLGITVALFISTMLLILLTLTPLFLPQTYYFDQWRRIIDITDTELNFVSLLIVFFHHLTLSPSIAQFIQVADVQINAIIRAIGTLVNAFIQSLNFNSVILLILTYLIARSVTQFGKILLVVQTDQSQKAKKASSGGGSSSGGNSSGSNSGSSGENTKSVV